jgi:hypothetical protein
MGLADVASSPQAAEHERKVPGVRGPAIYKTFSSRQLETVKAQVPDFTVVFIEKGHQSTVPCFVVPAFADRPSQAVLNCGVVNDGTSSVAGCQIRKQHTSFELEVRKRPKERRCGYAVGKRLNKLKTECSQDRFQSNGALSSNSRNGKRSVSIPKSTGFSRAR